MENFHGHIAVRLEHIAKEIKGLTTLPKDSIYNADIIQGGTFVEVMLELLLLNGIRDKDFEKKCKLYKDKGASEIPYEVAYDLFIQFKKLVGYSEADYTLDSSKVITTCPKCGKEITEANDAGNGFCIECTQNEEVD